MTERSASPVAEDLSDRIAAVVLAIPGVHGLHAGVFGEVATYLPGRRVRGIRVDERGCAVHVVLDWAAPIETTTVAIRRAVQPLVSGAIDVTVEDIAEPGADSP